MKILKLYVAFQGYKDFEYENISDLKEELNKRGISIGDRVSIGNRTSIGSHTSIGDDASIGYDASIDDHVSIGNRVSIGDRASISNGASISNCASIGYRVSTGYDASIGYGASISNRASIGNGASIGDRVSIVKTLFITGSRNTVNWYGTNEIQIGCIKMSIPNWLNQFEAIGKKHGYSDEAIKEYKNYIDICAKLQEDYGKV